MTDHLPTFLQIPMNITNSIDSSSDSIKINFRLNNEENWLKFSQTISDFDWFSVASDDIDEYIGNYTSKFNDLYCKCFPIKSKNISRKKCMNTKY